METGLDRRRGARALLTLALASVLLAGSYYAGIAAAAGTFNGMSSSTVSNPNASTSAYQNATQQMPELFSQPHTSTSNNASAQQASGIYATPTSSCSISQDFVNPFNAINVFVSLGAYPAAHLQNLQAGLGFPIGISSFGLDNNLTGTSQNLVDKGYGIFTDEIAGTVNVKSMTLTPSYNKMWDSSFDVLNSAGGGAGSGTGDPPVGTQLNVYLLFDYHGKQQLFWLQNTVSLVNNQYQIVENIWNETTPTANVYVNYWVGTSHGITGKGFPFSTPGGAGSPEQRLYIDVYPTSAHSPFISYGIPYLFPLSYVASIKTEQNGAGSKATVDVLFGFKVLKNSLNAELISLGCKICGAGGATGTIVYDDVRFPKGTTNPVLLVLPSASLASSFNLNHAIDAENLLGGAGGGDTVQFTNLNAQLGLTYDKNGKMVNFPSYWTFGTSTAETANDVISTIGSDGMATLTVGTINLLNGLTVPQSKTNTSQESEIKALGSSPYITEASSGSGS